MRKSIVVLASLVVLLSAQQPANADGPQISLDKFAPEININVTKDVPGRFANKFSKPVKADPNDIFAPGNLMCVDQPDGVEQCLGQGFAQPPKGTAAPTPGAILTAIKKIGLPSLTVNIQPGEATLVNFDTIFYAEPQPFRRSVSLLDYNIDVIATPVRYTWHHGDGTSQATNKPGRAYPAKDVTYRYFETAKHLQPRVDVTYAVRYRIDGGAWRTVDQTLQASGPAGDLEVKEATPVLAKP